MEDLSGKSVSKYQIIEKLGQGGMGVVYKALDSTLDRFVALKFLPPYFYTDTEAKQRFVLEAKAASALDHPNICTIYEIDESEEGQLFIAMAYYDGQSLKEKIAGGTLSFNESVDIAKQIASGLAKTHEKGIVHRDIKPANLLITTDGVAKILDFGVAKLTGYTKLTRTGGGTLGTVSYMSPEQVNGEVVDSRSDIWSLGVVLYEMLTGERPFTGEFDQVVMYSITSKTPKPPSDIVSNVPKGIETILSRALEKDLDLRYASMDEFCEYLKRPDTVQAKKNMPVFKKSKALLQKFLQKNKRRIIASAVLILMTVLAIKLWPPSEPGENATFPQKIQVAVPVFQVFPESPELKNLAISISDALVTKLGKSKYLRITRSPEPAVQTSASEIARQTNSQFIVFGRINSSNNRTNLLLQLFETSSSNNIRSESLEKVDANAIIDAVDIPINNMKIALELELFQTVDFTVEEIALMTNSVQAYLEYIEGKNELENRNYTESIGRFRDALRIDSTFAHAYEQLTRAYDLKGEYPFAKQAIETAIRLSVQQRLPKLEQQKMLLRKEKLNFNWDAEIEILNELILHEPEYAEWHYMLGFLYAVHKPSYAQSVIHLEKAIRYGKEQDKPSYYSYLGFTHLKWGNHEKAFDAFETYKSLNPNKADPYNAIGLTHLLAGNYQKAGQMFDEALDKNPDFLSAIKNMGDLYLIQGQGKRALHYYQDYLARAIGSTEEAAGYYNLARYFLESDQPGDFRKNLDKVFDLGVKHWPVSYLEAGWLLGKFHLKKGHLDSTQKILEQMQEFLRTSKSLFKKEFYHDIRGKHFLESKQYGAAIDEFKNAIELGPLDHAYFYDALAEVYFAKGDFYQAENALQNALKINPNYAQSHYMLGQIYERAGKNDDAKDSYNKFLEIWKNADINIALREEAKKRLERLLR